MATQKAYSVTLSKPGRDFGVWAGKTGGDSTRDTTDWYPGAMAPPIKLSDTPTTADLVVRRLERDLTDDDMRELYRDLESDQTYTVVVQRLRGRNSIFGAPMTYRCLIIGIAPSDTDAASADAATISVTLGVAGVPTVTA
jgi:hypothetical protein